MFTTLVVAVLDNPAKQYMFSVKERVKLLKESIDSIPGICSDLASCDIIVESYSGLLVDYIKKINADCVLRSLRSEADCAYELPMAQTNRRMAAQSGIHFETVALFANQAYSCISSGLVREIAQAGYSGGFDDTLLDEWVPIPVKTALRNKFK